MFVVDTNILLYAADCGAPEHDRCRQLLLGWRKQITAWHLTWGIVYEFLRVATHPNVYKKPFSQANAWSFVEALMATPGLSMLTETNRHQEVANSVFKQVPLLTGNLVFDAHTAILMKEHGVKTIYTRDTDFHRFPFIEVIDPLAS